MERRISRGSGLAAWLLCAAAAALPGVRAVSITPTTANSFSNQTVTFRSDVPVRWNIVPREARGPAAANPPAAAFFLFSASGQASPAKAAEC